MAEVTDPSEDEPSWKRPKQGCGMEIPFRKPAQTCHAGNRLAQHRQTAGDSDTGAARFREPRGSRIQARLIGEMESERPAEARGQAVGELRRQKQSDGRHDSPRERAVKPAKRRHHDRAGNGKKKVGDQKGDADEPCNLAMPVEKCAHGLWAEQGFKHSTPDQKRHDNRRKKQHGEKPETTSGPGASQTKIRRSRAGRPRFVARH